MRGGSEQPRGDEIGGPERGWKFQPAQRENPEVKKRLLGEAPSTPDENTNLFSFVTIMGARILLESERTVTGPKEKRELLKKICLWLPRTSEGKEKTVIVFPEVQRYLEEIKRALLSNGYNLKLCRIESSERVLIGTGQPFGRVPFEVGLSFDPLLNVPIIPSSSLKGAFRHALEEKGRRAEAKRIFGDKDCEGLVGVTDAFPVGIYKVAQRGRHRLFDPEVLTPHYPGVVKEFDVSPKPVVFLTVAPGVIFEFYIYYRSKYASSRRKIRVWSGSGTDSDVFEDDLAKLSALDAASLPALDLAVVYALSRGVGAKTSTGYSRFKILEYRTVGE